MKACVSTCISDAVRRNDGVGVMGGGVGVKPSDRRSMHVSRDVDNYFSNSSPSNNPSRRVLLFSILRTSLQYII